MSSVDEFISVKQISKDFHVHRSNIFRYLKKNNIETNLRRTPDSKSKLCSTITQDQYKHFLTLRREEGFCEESPIVEDEKGVFYIINIIPEFSEKRVKLGFTNNISTRLSSHKTSAPTSKVYKTWKCKRIWESTIIDYCKKEKHNFLCGEVFEFDDMKKLENSLDLIFELLN